MLASRRARFFGTGTLSHGLRDYSASPISRGRIPAQETHHRGLSLRDDLVEMAIVQNDEAPETYIDCSTMALVFTAPEGASLSELMDSLKSYANAMPRAERARTAALHSPDPTPELISEIRGALLRSNSFANLPQEPHA